MRKVYPLLEIYDWCKHQIKPFSAYALENRFDLHRNAAKVWLKDDKVFQALPMGSATYYLLLPGVSVDDFLAACDPKRRSIVPTLANTVVTNQFGSFDLTLPELPTEMQKVWEYLVTNKKDIEFIMQAADTATHKPVAEWSDQGVTHLIEGLGRCYQTVAVMQRLIERVITDPRLEDDKTLREVFNA
jgi:hypothetical protein